jgi:hypothetical protein
MANIWASTGFFDGIILLSPPFRAIVSSLPSPAYRRPCPRFPNFNLLLSFSAVVPEHQTPPPSNAATDDQKGM